MSLLENFTDFCYSPKPGGVTDVFADTERVLIQKNIDETNNKSKVISNLEKKIKESDNIGEQIRGMIKNFETSETENQKKDSRFRNFFPYGETYIKKATNGTIEEKLGSIEKTNIDQMSTSALAFAKLCKILLPKDYQENDTVILMDIFGSIVDYPIIDLKSNGMMSIQNLYILFNEFYMNYDLNTGINKETFFKKFVAISSLQYDVNQELDSLNIKRLIEDVYEFNPDYWYSNFDLQLLQGKDVVSDSYGAFFRAPGLSIINPGMKLGLGAEYTNFNPVFGSYERSYERSGTTTFLSNQSKVFCILFQENNTVNLIKDYKFPTDQQIDLANERLLNLLYNTQTVYEQKNPINNSVKFKKFYLPYDNNNNKYYKNAVTTGIKQSGGSKKKIKGGSLDNLFDTTSLPNLIAKRIPKIFNP